MRTLFLDQGGLKATSLFSREKGSNLIALYFDFQKVMAFKMNYLIQLSLGNLIQNYMAHTLGDVI